MRHGIISKKQRDWTPILTTFAVLSFAAFGWSVWNVTAYLYAPYHAETMRQIADEDRKFKAILNDRETPRLQLAADLAVRAAKVETTTDQATRDRYAAALRTWTGERVFDEECDERGFVSRDPTPTFPCFRAGAFVVLRTKYGPAYYAQTPKSSTLLNPHLTDPSDFRYVDINALITAAR